MHPRRTSFSARAGFTLSELLITMGISLLVVGFALVFFIYCLNIYSFDVGKNMVNRDIRTFTSELTDNATFANYFQIYPSFSERTATVASGGGSVVISADLEDKQTGDMLVLVYKDPADVDLVSRLVGYYRAPADLEDPNSEGPVRKFELTISPSSAAPIHSLLPALSTYATNPEVIELSKGLANGRLFYNIRGKSIMVNGQIIHRGGLGKTRYERATNTYNFTISPRG
jgi:prepilin-type N-terminal cleavage/methylation domain-containing protein